VAYVMKTSQWLALATPVMTIALLVAACSSGSSNGGSGSGSGGTSTYPTCQGATAATGAGTPACNTCLQTNCGAQTSAVESSCGAYLTCYEGCQCSNLSCLAGCLTDIDTACAGVDGKLTTCLTQSCASECTTAIVGDAGAGGG
jgi:hypothetical protein